MTVNRIARDSAGPVWVSFALDNPVTGRVDLLDVDGGGTDAPVSIAITQNARPTTSEFVTAYFEAATRTNGSNVYNVAARNVTADTFAVGEYEVWVKVTYDSNDYVFRAGPITVY